MPDAIVSIPCGEIVLEGRLGRPAIGEATAGLVVCHPHPLYGGDMNSPIVTSLCDRAQNSGLATLRFNFRGTGRSGGRHTKGEQEPEDVKAAIDVLQRETGLADGRIGLAGYSFGSLMALAAGLSDDRVTALAAISPPLRMRSLEDLRSIDKPLLLIAGSADEYVGAADLENLAARFPHQIRVQIVPGEDHFWWGDVAGLAATVADYFLENF